MGKDSGLFKPIVVVRLYGGLGNQLFTYAAAKRLSVYNNCRLYIDSGSGFIRDHVYKRSYQLAAFEISAPNVFWGTFIGLIFTYLRRVVFIKNKNLPVKSKFIVQQKKIDFDPDLLSLQLKNLVIFEGFWQSENYFKDIENIIRTEFRFRKSVVHEFLPLVKKINFSKAVAIHVRHFKDEHHLNQGNVSDLYYKRAIQYFQQRIPGAEFWLFSDNTPKALNKLSGIDVKCVPVSSYLKANNEIQELFLMTQFRNFIIANSTFSWWGAWLSDSIDKQVVAPAEIIDSGEGCWGFEGLIPVEWVTL